MVWPPLLQLLFLCVVSLEVSATATDITTTTIADTSTEAATTQPATTTIVTTTQPGTTTAPIAALSLSGTCVVTPSLLSLSAGSQIVHIAATGTWPALTTCHTGVDGVLQSNGQSTLLALSLDTSFSRTFYLSLNCTEHNYTSACGTVFISPSSAELKVHISGTIPGNPTELAALTNGITSALVSALKLSNREQVSGIALRATTRRHPGLSLRNTGFLASFHLLRSSTTSRSISELLEDLRAAATSGTLFSAILSATTRYATEFHIGNTVVPVTRPDSDDDDDEWSSGEILVLVLSVVGAVLCLIFAAVVFDYYCHRRKEVQSTAKELKGVELSTDNARHNTRTLSLEERPDKPWQAYALEEKLQRKRREEEAGRERVKERAREEEAKKYNSVVQMLLQQQQQQQQQQQYSHPTDEDARKYQAAVQFLLAQQQTQRPQQQQQGPPRHGMGMVGSGHPRAMMQRRSPPHPMGRIHPQTNHLNLRASPPRTFSPPVHGRPRTLGTPQSVATPPDQWHWPNSRDRSPKLGASPMMVGQSSPGEIEELPSPSLEQWNRTRYVHGDDQGELVSGGVIFPDDVAPLNLSRARRPRPSPHHARQLHPTHAIGPML